MKKGAKMLTLCRRALSNVNRYACIAQSVAAPAAATRLQPSFIRHCSYEGDGKTKVKVLNIDMEMGLMINSISEVKAFLSVSELENLTNSYVLSAEWFWIEHGC